MKTTIGTLEKFLSEVSYKNLGGELTENEIYDLNKFGFAAFNLLESAKQVLICQIFADIYK